MLHARAQRGVGGLVEQVTGWSRIGGGWPALLTKELLKQPTTKPSAEWFACDAWADAIYCGEGPSRPRANVVRFAPRRPHRLALPRAGQTLYIVEGIALVQSRGGRPSKPTPGT